MSQISGVQELVWAEPGLGGGSRQHSQRWCLTVTAVPGVASGGAVASG